MGMDTRLERIQEAVEQLPTDGTPAYHCHDDAPEHLERETLPVDPNDRKQLLKYNKELEKYKSDQYHAQLLNYGMTFCRYRNPPTPNGDENSAHNLSLASLLEDPSAAQQFEDWVMTLPTEDGDIITPKTESHYRNMIREYGELMGESGRPSHIEKIPSTSPRKNKYKPTPSRSNILFWNESVVPILDSVDVHLRDKALLAVAWDSGARPSELRRMQAYHLTDKGDRFHFEIEDSKTYDRVPHLQVSMPYLRKWLLKVDQISEDSNLSTAPLSLPPEQFIWTKQQSPEKLQPGTFGKIGRKIGERLGYARPTNLKQFRKSRASILAAEGLSQTALRCRFGWEYNSPSPAHYVAIFNEEVNQEIADIDGAPIDITQDFENPSPVECSSCDRWSPNHLDNCFWCGTELIGDKQAKEAEIERLRNKAEVNQAAKSELKDQMADVELSARSMEVALDIVNALESDPTLTKESIAFLMMTEYDDIGPEKIMGLLEEGDDGLREILKRV